MSSFNLFSYLMCTSINSVADMKEKQQSYSTLFLEFQCLHCSFNKFNQRLTLMSQIKKYQFNHSYQYRHRHFIETDWKRHASDRISWICLIWQCFRPVYEFARLIVRRYRSSFFGGFRFLRTFLYLWKHQTFTNDTSGSV